LNTGNSGAYFNSAKALGTPINFWQMNPLGAAASVMRNFGGGTNTNIILEARRRLSAGLAVNASYTFQRSHEIVTSGNAGNGNMGVGTAFEIHQPEFNLQTQGVPHAFKMLWTYDIPFGRGKRFGANIDQWADYIIGGWTFAGTGRVQIQDFVLRNSVLVGMTHDEAQAALKDVRFVTDASGVTTVWNFPQDIIDNTRKAYNTDETQPTFYTPGQEPTGRYFAPAGGPACNFLYQGDCNTEELWFKGRWFGEFDFRLSKMVPLPSKARFEVSAEVFNALMAKNFPVSLKPGQWRQRLPHPEHAEQRAHGAARLPRELVKSHTSTKEAWRGTETRRSVFSENMKGTENSLKRGCFLRSLRCSEKSAMFFSVPPSPSVSPWLKI
jgi:hypothetical protein